MKTRRGPKSATKHSSPKRGSDRLTAQERAIVKAKLANPDAPARELATIAGLRGSLRVQRQTVNRSLALPRVKAALLHPMPEHTADPEAPAEPLSAEWIKVRAKKMAEDPQLSTNERLRALEFLAKMTPGAFVPIEANVRGQLTLEHLVAMSGGKPADALMEHEVVLPSESH